MTESLPPLICVVVINERMTKSLKFDDATLFLNILNYYLLLKTKLFSKI